MKIAIASDDRINICPHFGRATGFEIAEIEDDKIITREFHPNDFTGHARDDHDASHEDKHAIIVNALKDCKAVIANGMGLRIQNDLRAAGIEAFLTDETVVEAAIDKYIKGSLDNNPERGCSH